MKTQPLLQPHVRLRGAVVLVITMAMLSACSILQEDKIDYKTAQRGNNLEVPPDLTQLSRQSRYALPSDVITASELDKKGISQSLVATAPTQMGSVAMERSGSQRW